MLAMVLYCVRHLPRIGMGGAVDGQPDPRTVVERLREAINARDRDALAACFAPEYLSEFPAHPAHAFRGHEQSRRNWARIFGGAPDLAATLVGCSMAGDTAWAGWDWRGTRRDAKGGAMILIAGGTGTLGRRVVRLLAARGLPVRILTRDPSRAAGLVGAGVEVAAGDVREPASVTWAMAGARTVISAIQGFSGTGGDSPETVDRAGNGVLIRAAREAGAGHFILVSVQGTAPDHPMGLFRAKYQAEQALRASGLAWTILRPTASMETWVQLVGKPLVETGRTRIFGHGHNRINFVAADDVARFVELAVVDPALRGQVVEVGGPENLTMRQVAQTFQAVTGKNGTVRHVPLPVMRAMAVLLRPVNATIARQIQAGVVMDTRDLTFDPAETTRRYPAIVPTPLAEVVARDFGAGRWG